MTFDDFIPFKQGELGWQGMGDGGDNAEIERLLAEMEAKKLEPPAELPAPAAADPPVTALQGAGDREQPQTVKPPRKPYKKREPKPPFVP